MNFLPGSSYVQLMSLILKIATQMCLYMQFCYNYFDLVSLQHMLYCHSSPWHRGVQRKGSLQSCPGCQAAGHGWLLW